MIRNEKSQIPTFETQIETSLAPSAPRILIVEDELGLRTPLIRVLRDVDPKCECDWVVRVSDACRLLKTQNYDLIFADYYLGEKQTGWNLWQICNRKYPEIPFVIISAMGIEKYLRMVKGKDRWPFFLPKPFTRSEYQASVRTHLARRYPHYLSIGSSAV